MDSTGVLLPGGTLVGGEWRRSARLRPLTGLDEAAVLSTDGGSVSPAARTTALLARCLAELGGQCDVTEDAVRTLSVGDREALLLHLRRATFGDRLACVVTCPAPTCGDLMDLDLRVDELLLAPYPDARPRYEASLTDTTGGQRQHLVSFRVPNGADQEAVAELAHVDVARAAADILDRCIEHAESLSDAAQLSATVAQQLVDVMAQLDPQADIVLDLSCPSCGHTFQVAFDTAEFLFSELRAGAGALFHDVHTLALTYHWAEADILGLSSARRRMYLELIGAPE